MILTEIIIILLSWLGRFGYIEAQQKATWLPGSLFFPSFGADEREEVRPREKSHPGNEVE